MDTQMPVTPSWPQTPTDINNPVGQGLGQTAVGQAVQSGVWPTTTPNTYQQPTSGGMQKEVLPTPATPIRQAETVPLVEVGETEKIPEEVEGYLEKLEQAGEIKIPEAVKKDEQVILDNAAPVRVVDTVVLPLTQTGAVVAAKQKVTDSALWLYTWCKRIVQMLGERARYRE